MLWTKRFYRHLGVSEKRMRLLYLQWDLFCVCNVLRGGAPAAPQESLGPSARRARETSLAEPDSIYPRRLGTQLYQTQTWWEFRPQKIFSPPSTFGITWCHHFWPNLRLEVAEGFHIRWRMLAAQWSALLWKTLLQENFGLIKKFTNWEKTGGGFWGGGGVWAREIGTICPFGVFSPVL